MTRPSRPERFGAIELLAERGDRLRAQRRLGGGEVDQVAVVRDDRLDAGLLDPRAEQRDLVGWQRPRPPLPHRLGEDLQRLAPRSPRARSTARGRPPAIDRWAPSRGISSRSSRTPRRRSDRRGRRARQASARGRSALTHVCRRNCSRVQPPLGRDLRQQQAAVVPLLDDQAVAADRRSRRARSGSIGSSGPRTETSIDRSGSSRLA